MIITNHNSDSSHNNIHSNYESHSESNDNNTVIERVCDTKALPHHLSQKVQL